MITKLRDIIDKLNPFREIDDRITAMAMSVGNLRGQLGRAEARISALDDSICAQGQAINITQKQFADLARECMDRADRELKFQRESYRASHDSLSKRIVDLEERLGIPTPLDKAMQPMVYLPDQPEEDE